MSATGQMFQMTPPQSLADGTVVAGRYRVIGKLGEGGMGAVYRAIQQPLGREVALKVIAPALTKDADSVERFRREAKAASSLSHPNIVTVFDFGEDNGLLFLAMELIPGIGLDQAIRRGPMSPQRAIPILRGVCAALAEAHAHGIIHRDLKPQNIMLTSTSTQQDVVKVVDFGIARLSDQGNAALTRTGAVVGTPGYVAPEFFDGAPASPMSDLYAVGVVAYELLAGVTPFPLGSPREILKAVLFGEPQPLRVVAPHVPAPLEQFVTGLMSKDPTKRPSSARSIEAALAALQPSGGSSTSIPLSAGRASSREAVAPGTSVRVLGLEPGASTASSSALAAMPPPPPMQPMAQSSWPQPSQPSLSQPGLSAMSLSAMPSPSLPNLPPIAPSFASLPSAESLRSTPTPMTMTMRADAASEQAPVAEVPRRRLPGVAIAVIAAVVGFALGTPLVTRLLPAKQQEQSATIEELRAEALRALRARKHLEAKELAEEVLRREPNDYEALRLLGNALAFEARHDEATKAYQGFLKLAPKDHPRRPFVENAAASGATEFELL
jgi:serine/threonine protein kinase